MKKKPKLIKKQKEPTTESEGELTIDERFKDLDPSSDSDDLFSTNFSPF